MAIYNFDFDGHNSVTDDGWTNGSYIIDTSPNTLGTSDTPSVEYIAAGTVFDAVTDPWKATGSLDNDSDIVSVSAKLRCSVSGNADLYWHIMTSDSEFLGYDYVSTQSLGYTTPVTLTEPTGGWTWQKIQDLEVTLDINDYGAGPYSVEVGIVSLDVTVKPVHSVIEYEVYQDVNTLQEDFDGKTIAQSQFGDQYNRASVSNDKLRLEPVSGDTAYARHTTDKMFGTGSVLKFQFKAKSSNITDYDYFLFFSDTICLAYKQSNNSLRLNEELPIQNQQEISLVADRWFRIREDNGDIRFEYSDDGNNWTGAGYINSSDLYNRASQGYISFNVQTDQASGEYFEIDNVNIDVQTGTLSTDQIDFTFIPPATDYTIQKTANYAVLSADDLSKVGQYAVQSETTVQKSSEYQIQTTTTEQITAEYSIAVANDKQLSSSYVVTFTDDKQITASYLVLTGEDLQKPTQYAVQSDQTIQKTASYEIALKAEELIDDFDDNSLDNSKWNWGSGVNEVNNQLEISITGSNYHFLNSQKLYNLEDSYIKVEVIDPGVEYYSREAGIRIQAIGSDRLAWIFIGNGSIESYYRNGGGVTYIYSRSYNASTDRFLRIRESGGTIYFDVSGDGTSWTNHSSLSNPYNTTLFEAQIYHGQWQVSPDSTAKFDNFNIDASLVTVQKSASYAIITDSTIQKSADYEIVSDYFYTTQVSASYTIQTNPVRQVTANYLVLTGENIEKPAEYKISSVTNVEVSTHYQVASAPSTLQKTASYVVESAVDSQITASYLVLSGEDLQKPAQYAIQEEKSSTVDAEYTIAAENTLNLSASYIVGFATDVQKAAQYSVLATYTTQVGAEYIVASDTTLDLTAQYCIPTEQVIQIAGTHKVLSAGTVDVEAEYEVLTKNTVQAPAEYRVATLGNLAKTALYLVGTETTVQVGAEYDVARIVSVPASYKVQYIQLEQPKIIYDDTGNVYYRLNRNVVKKVN